MKQETPETVPKDAKPSRRTISYQTVKDRNLLPFQRKMVEEQTSYNKTVLDKNSIALICPIDLPCIHSTSIKNLKKEKTRYKEKKNKKTESGMKMDSGMSIIQNQTARILD